MMDPLLAANYAKLKDAARGLISKGRTKRDGHLVSTTVQALLAYPDRAWQGETISDKHDVTQFSLEPIPPDRLLPKELDLITLIQNQRAAGRRVLVYCTHTRTRDITRRLEHILTKSNIRTAILPVSVKPEKRMEWINTQTQKGLDGLICNAKAVQTGLDLIEFPTIIWYEPEYAVTVVRQASRRSYSFRQPLPVEVHFLIYKHTAQEYALAHTAAGINASLHTEGDVDAEGLNEYQQPDDLMSELINRILDDNTSLPSAESMFARLAATYKQMEPPSLPPPATLTTTATEDRQAAPNLEPQFKGRTRPARIEDNQLTLFAA